MVSRFPHLPGGLSRRRFVQAAVAASCTAPWWAAHAREPLLVGYNAALSVPAWTAPAAIETGLRIAMAEVNAAGGVLGGRPLELLPLDHRTTVARARQNAQTLAARPEVVAMFCDAFSPTALDLAPLVHELRLPLLNPWAAADGIIDHGLRPSYTFRLALRDSWAMPAIVRRAAARRIERLGLLALSNAWGRSNEAALRAALAGQTAAPALAGLVWHDATDDARAMSSHIEALRSTGADAVVLVAAVDDSCALAAAMAALPRERRLPVLSHWGLAAGDFFTRCRPFLGDVDLEVVQTFSFDRARHPRAAEIARDAARRMEAPDAQRLPSAAGVAHAYDLLHLLAMAIDRAGRADRVAVRDALVRLPAYDGLVRRFERPFTPDRHEALSPSDVFLARFDRSGQLRRAA